MENLIFHILKFVPAQSLGRVFARLQKYFADPQNPAIGEYAATHNNPQALCFMMDIYPSIRSVFSRFHRGEVVRFLDIGPAFGSSAGLISQMYCSDFLGPRIHVDVLDIVECRRRYIELTYPLVNFIHSAVEDVSISEKWDVIYCSNTIEHHESPAEFVKEIMKMCKGYGIFIAPYNEAHPLSPGHTGQISELTFADLKVHHFEIFKSSAWPTTSDGVERSQLVAVVSNR